LEEKHIPTAAKLAEICFEVAAHDARVWDVEDGELGDALRVEQGDAPSDGGTPIVAGEEDALLAELIGDGEYVGSEFIQCVGCCASRFATFVVTALIGDDDTETDVCERLDLFVPGIPEFGETVEEDDDGAVGRAGGNGVEFDRAVVKG